MSGLLSFAQYLLAEQIVDRGAITEALDLMESENRELGRIAVSHDLLTEFDAERIAQAQRRSDRPFGMIAVDLGLITREDVDRLTKEQASRNIGLGEALVRLGRLETARLETARVDFDAVRMDYESVGVTLPRQFEGSPLAAKLVDLIPRCMIRIARIEVRLHPGEPPVGARRRLRASIRMTGNPPLELGLCSDQEFASRVAMGVLGFEPGELEVELIEDGLGEFLNIVAGNVVAVLSQSGIDVGIEPPRPGVAIPKGMAFEIISFRGGATLYLG